MSEAASGGSERRPTDGELLDHLRDLDDRIPGPVTQRTMRVLGDYGTTTYSERFGSWGKAKRKAGVQPSHGSSTGAANMPTEIGDDVARFLETNWRDAVPLLEIHDAYVEGDAGIDAPGFRRQDCPPRVRDNWQTFALMEGMLEKVQRCENDSSRWLWRLPEMTYEAITARVEANEEAKEIHGEDTPLPCNCFPLAVTNHGETIECHHCETEYPRELCGGRDE